MFKKNEFNLSLDVLSRATAPKYKLNLISPFFFASQAWYALFLRYKINVLIIMLLHLHRIYLIM